MSEETTTIATAASREVVAFARNPVEMQQSQDMLIKWAREKFVEEETALADCAPLVFDGQVKILLEVIFDELGVLPSRRSRHGDPMVVGRIVYKEGYNERTMSFLIAWWMSKEDL